MIILAILSTIITTSGTAIHHDGNSFWDLLSFVDSKHLYSNHDLRNDPDAMDAIARLLLKRFDSSLSITVDTPRANHLRNNGDLALTKVCAFHQPTYLFRVHDIHSEFNHTEFAESENPNVFDFFLRPTVYEKTRVECPTAATPRQRTSHPNMGNIWLHIEKTAGSFGPTAFQFEYLQPSGPHGLPPVGGCGERCRFVSLFRDPFERTLSSFYFNPPSCLFYDRDPKNCMSKYFTLNHQEPALETPSTLSIQIGRKHGVLENVNLWACQAKVILGFRCEARIDSLPPEYRSPEALIAGATSRLRSDYDFIGVTEYFDASVVLMHQILCGQLDVNSQFLKTNTRKKPLDYVASANCKKGYSNAPDSAVLFETKAFMVSNILRHHSNIVRLVDTSGSIDELRVPYGDAMGLVHNSQYMLNLTRVLARDFSMSDEACVRM